MDRVIETASTLWAVSGLVFLAIGAGAVVAVRGRLRVAVALTSLFVAASLFTAAFLGSAPDHRTDTVTALPKGPRAADPDRRSAMDLVARAEDQLNRGDGPAAEQSYTQALALYRDRNDVLGEALVRLGLGRMEHVTGQSDEARAYYAEALSLYREHDSTADQARVLVAMGDLERDTFHWVEAAKFYRQGRMAWEAAPGQLADSHVLLNLAAAPRMPYGEERARLVLEQAELIYQKIGDVEGLADVRMFAGALNNNLGKMPVAKTDFADALAMYVAAGNYRRASTAALEVARTDIALGLNISAAINLESAAELLSRVGDSPGIARMHVLRGDLERLQGQMPAARAEYATAIAALREASPEEVPDVLVKLAWLDAYLGSWDTARAGFDKAAALFAEYEGSTGKAEADLALGILAARQGEVSEAEQLLDDAAILFREAGDALGEGRALLMRADLAATRNQSEAARGLYVLGDARFAEAGATIGRVLAALGLGDMEWAEGNGASARQSYISAENLVAQMKKPVAEANRFLGLPPVSALRLVDASDTYQDGAGADDRVLAEAEEARAANLTSFPDHNAEGRALWMETEARLANAASFVRPD